MVVRADVARLAGTSPSVVSYVLNGSRPVAPGTRARVLAAIEELGYRPNAVARSLRTSRTHTLGLIVPDAANHFFAELSGAIEEAAFTAGYTVLVGNAVNDRSRELAYLRTFIDRQVDGLILCPAGDAEHLVGEVERASVPTVLTDRSLDLVHVPSVRVDHEGGAKSATEHLLGHGRALVGCVAGPADMGIAMERVSGWRAALEAAGLAPHDGLVQHAPFSADGGYRAALTLLEAHPDLDGLLVSSDEQAFGALRALSDAGRPAPHEVAVASFDGIAGGAYTTPRLTTAAQPFASISQAVVELLEQRIQSPERSADPGLARALPVELVVRESCGCHPRDGR